MTAKSNVPEVEFESLKRNPVDLVERKITLYSVNISCSLKNYLKSTGVNFVRGCVYYEFKHKVESISDDKQVIFMDKVKKAHVYLYC